MNMTKEKHYRITIRSYAKQLVESGCDSMSGYIIEDITARTEKTFLNRYIKELERDIPTYKEMKFEEKKIELMEKALKVCNDRLNFLNNK